ncbi:MAG: hypothetical protein KBE65_13465 [Phycisphaerae bacterium]|nr:hypothetical protein [Phycisphaerae bacterium]
MDRIRRTIARGIVCAVVVLCCTNALSGVEFAGGTGEPNDPYQIATAEQLISIGSDPNLLDKCFLLVSDIDLDPNLPGGQVFSRSLIAPELQNVHGWVSRYFQGVLDGGGHAIRNLTIHTEKERAAGLFGYIDSPAQVRDLGLEGVDIRRTATGSQAFIGGGLVAFNGGGVILGCYATGSVAEDSAFVPRAGDDSSDCIGGLVGANYGLVHACYALVNVRADGIVGGFIGRNEGAVHFSFAAGAINGSGWVGGLIGRSDAGSVLHSYWDRQTGGVLESAGGLSKTSGEMMSRDTYVSWIHTGVWMLDDGKDYSRLLWQKTSGTPIGDVPPGYDGGTGAPENPYQIGTPEQFIAIAYRPQDFDRSFALTADLDFRGVDSNDIRPIGLEHLAFSGQFDGRSYSLSNLSILRPDDQCVGVFGLVGPSNVYPRGQTIHYSINDNVEYGWGYGTRGRRTDYTPPTTISIRNVRLRDVAVVGREYVGGLIGLGQAVVEDCSVSGEVTGLSMVGGLLGRSMRGGLTRCSVDGRVTGEFAVGGLTGTTWPGDGLAVEDCHVRGDVTGQLHAGGLIGFSQGAEDSVGRCSAECDVHGRYFTGGCFGSTTGSTTTTTYARGAVTGESWMGGFAGQVLYATVSDSYCVAAVAGERKVGGFAGCCREERLARCYAAATATASDTDSECPLAGAFIAHMGSFNDDCADNCPIDISACFWDADLSGPLPAIGNCPFDILWLTRLPTAQMQTADPFLDAGWDFESTWTICEGKDYPRLQWENVDCNAVTGIESEL